jgi:hypothetical protein
MVEEQYEEDVMEEVQLTYKIISDGVQISRQAGSLLGDDPHLTATIILQNTGTEAGEFSFTQSVSDNENSLTFFGQKSIPAGATLELSDTKVIPPYSFQSLPNVSSSPVQIIAPKVQVSKKVTKTRKVPKERICNPCKENCNQ